MNMEKLTNKTREALSGARQIALERHNTELKNIHVLAALLKDENGLAGSILSRMGVDRKLFGGQVETALDRLPRMQSAGQDLYNSNEVLTLLSDAAKAAESMQDEYISVEHLLLAMLKNRSEASSLLEQSGIDTDRMLSALQAIRGNQRVTSEDPESTFEALKKYSRDLTQLAMQDKLDPVIGRDE
ncbi:MAG: type VI secretion system ATPase TssH, partial [Lentisphaeria bacterium]|nr:type VI secretion system ATPase TssH [Lentisphaeria bacterium]